MKARELCSFRSVLFVFVNITIIIYYILSYGILNAGLDQPIVCYSNYKKSGTFSDQLKSSNWSNLAELGDFAQQAKYLVRRLRLSRAEARRCSELIDGLRHQLRKHWPEFKMVPFGSVVNGLALSTGLSDIDVRVILPQANGTLFKPSDLVVQAAEVISSNKSYTIIATMPNTTVPIVRLNHSPTNQKFDVSFRKSSISNTEIINYLFKIDRRALHLMIIVKYWAKRNSLQISHVTPSVMWYFLVIFYLQQVKILPPAHILQKSAEPKMLNHWNFAFEERYEYLYQSEDNTPLYELLGGFFTYYTEIDLKKNCISVFAGIPISRRMFNSVETVSDIFLLYKYNVKHNITSPLKVNSVLCILDIFEHDDNVAGSVTLQFFDKLNTSFQQASKIFRTHRKTDFLIKLLST